MLSSDTVDASRGQFRSGIYQLEAPASGSCEWVLRVGPASWWGWVRWAAIRQVGKPTCLRCELVWEGLIVNHAKEGG